jgi:adenylosuccinate lyase
MKEGAARNDLLDRLSADREWKVPLREMKLALVPSSFVGRAPEQVDEFLREVVGPLLEGAETRDAEEVRV